VDLKKAAFSDADAPLAPLYFNQTSPSKSQGHEAEHRMTLDAQIRAS